MFIGKSHTDKLVSVREELVRHNAHGIIISALDELAWLFNLRGSDVECNPVFFAYAVVTQHKAILYLDDIKITDEVREHLGTGVTLRPYQQVFEDLRSLSENLKQDNQVGYGCGPEISSWLTRFICLVFTCCLFQ